MHALREAHLVRSFAIVKRTQRTTLWFVRFQRDALVAESTLRNGRLLT